MGCEYIFNGNTYSSYQELIDGFSDADLENALSILFSQTDKQTAVFDSLMELKRKHQYTWDEYNVIDGDPSLDAGERMSIQKFIDSHYFMVEGKPPMFKLDRDEYLKHKKKELVSSEIMTEENAEAYINTIQANWDTVGEDAFDLHKLLVSTKGGDDLSYQELSAAAGQTAFASIAHKVVNASSDIISKVFLKNGTDKVGAGNKGRLIKNINLAAELIGLDKEIVGHIDYLIVRDNGDIEVFNIKTSTESYASWDSVKKEKYRYQMALLKRILEFNGISAKNIRMNIIPVKLTYNSTFEYVTNIEVESVVPMDFKDQEYILRKYDTTAAQFVPSSVNIEPISSEVALKLHTQLQHIFPGRDIEAYGIKETAKTWVEHNWRQLQPKARDGGGWEITLPGDEEPTLLDDPRHGVKNEELLELVQERLEDLSSNVKNDRGIYRTVTDIVNAYERSGGYFPSGAYGRYISERLSKYFVKASDTSENGGKFKYVWKLISSDLLINSGILIFWNQNTNQLDVVTFTNFDVGVEYKFKGRNNLLGYYLPDVNNERFSMRSNYGNIEAIRTMIVLNEVLPSIKGNYKLGELKILGISNQFSGKKGRVYDLAQLAPQFDTVIKVVNQNNENKIVNNFKEKGFTYVDAAAILIQQWQEIVSNNPNLTEIKSLDEYMTQKHLLDGTTIEGLLHIETVEAKVEKLQMLLEKLKKMAIERGIPIGKPEQLLAMAKRNDKDLNTAIAALFIAATRALNQYHGDYSLENEKFGQIQEYALKTTSINNSNVRQVGSMFQRTIDKIAGDMVTRYANIRGHFVKFYEEAGYGKMQNSIIGNQASMYKNLYETDDQGKRLMIFKNPYDPNSNLKNYEREFLKNILFEFYKVRCEMLGIPQEIKGPDDPQLSTDMPKNYLNAPLERASAATRRTNLKQGFREWGKRIWRMITRPKDFFEELEGLIDPKERSRRAEDIEYLQAYNPFKNSEASEEVRNSYIRDKGGSDYFEYNVENLFIDFLEKHVQSQEFSRMLFRAKGIELDLLIRGEVEDAEEEIRHTIKTINDFLDINVFNKSIIGDDFKKVEAIMAPLRHAVSTFYVAGNVAGAARDSFQGLLENISSAVIKFQTDIGVKDVAFGYKEVISEGVGNLMTMTKLNQFNVKYRFSNLDVARISEGQKTGRGGILNGEQWAYSTLRGPDYLNRMVLFVAKMNKDGCYDAYTLDDEKRLVYNWKKDKRFNILAKGELGKKENLEEYKKQQALYYSLIRAFNMEGYRKENGEQLNYSDPLPDAYTLQEIQTFKTFSDNIYGSYNKSTRAKYEHTAIGRNFMFFSTWMNGLVDVYMKQTQVSGGETKLEQEYDYNGNPLFFEEDGTITDRDTGVPVMKGVPIMVQGVFATLTDIAKTLYHCGMDEEGNWSLSKGIEAVKTDILTSDVATRNLKRALRDLLIGGLFASLFKAWMSNLYKNHKEKTKGEDIAANAMMEVLYKSSTSCFDTFYGPFAIVDYIGNQTNPATYKLQSKIFRDIWGYVVGDKTMGQILISSQALPRTFQDTYNLWVRDTKSSEE